MQTSLRVAAVVLGALLFIHTPRVGHTLDLIVEAGAGGQNAANFKSGEGKWIPSKRKSTAPGLSRLAIGAQKAVLGGLENSGPAAKRRLSTVPVSARFHPQLGSPARLHAYITWPRGANVQPVTITVKHVAGEEKIAQAQRGYGTPEQNNANCWIPLGEFEFGAGDDQWVELRVEPGFNSVYRKQQIDLVADAVRFSSTELPADQLAVGPPAPKGAASNRTRKPAKPTPANTEDAGADADGDEEVDVVDDAEEVTVIPFETAALEGAPITGPEGVEARMDAPATIDWHDTLEDGRATAKAANRKLLIFFADPELAESKDMEAALADGEPVGLIAREYVAVKLDFATNKKLATTLGIPRAGCMAIYDAQGKAQHLITGIEDAPHLAEQLRKF